MNPTDPPNATRYWFDTEFIEDGTTIDLISIGIVCEDGRELYLESSEVDWTKASDWVLQNVRPHLTGVGLCTRRQIALDVIEFVGQDASRPEFWAYYADYDWVVLCQLYGTMMDLPKSWPMFCMDVKQEAQRLGNPTLPEQTSTEHHALADARWTRDAWTFLRASTPEPKPEPDEIDEDIARAFHSHYERLAPEFGYETRPESAVRFDDVPEPNRSLMIAVAGHVRTEIVGRLAEENARLLAEVDRAHDARIEAQNPGIDMDEVRARRSASRGAAAEEAPPEPDAAPTERPEWIELLITSGGFDAGDVVKVDRWGGGRGMTAAVKWEPGDDDKTTVWIPEMDWKPADAPPAAAPPEPPRPEWVKLTAICGGWETGTEHRVMRWSLADRPFIATKWHDSDGPAAVVVPDGSWVPAVQPVSEPEPAPTCPTCARTGDNPIAVWSCSDAIHRVVAAPEPEPAPPPDPLADVTREQWMTLQAELDDLESTDEDVARAAAAYASTVDAINARAAAAELTPDRPTPTTWVEVTKPVLGWAAGAVRPVLRWSPAAAPLSFPIIEPTDEYATRYDTGAAQLGSGSWRPAPPPAIVVGPSDGRSMFPIPDDVDPEMLGDGWTIAAAAPAPSPDPAEPTLTKKEGL